MSAKTRLVKLTTPSGVVVEVCRVPKAPLVWLRVGARTEGAYLDVGEVRSLADVFDDFVADCEEP